MRGQVNETQDVDRLLRFAGEIRHYILPGTSGPQYGNYPETGMWEITPEKSASVYECVRSCRSSECHLMKTGFCLN